MTQGQIDHITIISYLKNLSEFQARILSHLEKKTYEEVLNESVKNLLECEKGLFNIFKMNNYKDNPKEQAEIDTYVSNIDNQLSKL